MQCDWQRGISLIKTLSDYLFLKVSALLLAAIVSSHLTWDSTKSLPDVWPLNSSTDRSDVKHYGMLYGEIIVHNINSIKGYRNINMMRASYCSWLLEPNMLINRPRRLSSEWAYQGVQLFPAAPATGNKGWGTFRGVWWARSQRLESRSVYALSSSAFQFTPPWCIGVLGMKCRSQRPPCRQCLS